MTPFEIITRFALCILFIFMLGVISRIYWAIFMFGWNLL